MSDGKTFKTNGHAVLAVEDILKNLDQPLPWSEEAERGVISCILQNPALLERDDLSSRLFYSFACRDLYRMLCEMHRKYLPIDAAALTVYARSGGFLEGVGGPAAISEIATFIPIPAHFSFYLATLKQASTLRLKIGALAESLSTVQAFSRGNGEATLSGICEQVELLLASATEADLSDEIPHRPIGQILDAVIDDSQKRAENPGAIPGVSTGIRWLDEHTGGLDQGRLWVVAGASSDGKSSLSRQMLEHAASLDHATDIYTYEMMDTEEAGRIICSEGRVSRDAVKFGKYSRAEQQMFQTVVTKVKAWDMRIIDVAGVRIERICASIKRRRKRLKPGQRLVSLVDYIQLALTEVKESSRQRQLAHISGMLKQTAKTTGTTIIVPCQINKDGDAREAMDIENDSDVFIKIKRLEPVKAKKGYERAKDKDGDVPDNEREIYIHKNRDGPRNLGTKMRLLGQHFRFEPVY